MYISRYYPGRILVTTPQVQIIDKFDGRTNNPGDHNKDKDGDNNNMTSDSIVLYTELIRCLVNDGNEDDDSMLLKVFLVFQEMRNAGAIPDVACYNSLLRACAFSGDIDKAMDVLRRMEADGIEPNRNSWRELIKAARVDSNRADLIWRMAIQYKTKDVAPFIPKPSDVELLLNVYVNELRSTNNHEVRNVLNKKVMRLYEGIVMKAEDQGLHHVSSRLDEIEDNQEFMFPVLRAAVSYELHGPTDEERRHARELACDIAGLQIFQRRLSSSVDRSSKKALQQAQNWLYSY